MGATATTGVRGVANTAYAFNGSSNYIWANLSPQATNQVSMSLWVNSSVMPPPSDKPIFSQQNNNSDRFELVPSSDGTLYFTVSNKSTAIDTNLASFSTYILSNTWTHVLVTVNSLGSGIYINGILRQSKTWTNGFVPNITINAPMNFGKGFSAQWFNGSIDNIRMYNKALSADEVMNIYNTEKP